MAYPTAVNGQITDAVTQSGVSILAQAPAIAMGTIYQSAAHSIGILFQNSTMAQQHAAMAAQAATNQGVMQIYSSGTMAGAMAARKVAQSDKTQNLLLALVLLQMLR